MPTEPNTEKNPLELSDDEFLNMAAPPAIVEEQAPSADQATSGGDTATGADAGAATTVNGGAGDDTLTGDTGSSTETATVAGGAGQDALQGSSGQDTVAGGSAQDSQAGATPSGSAAGATGADALGEKAKDQTPDYEGFFKKVMAPIKANGKTVEVRTPEEAIQLMQMGANYTRKMQDIAPHRKVLTMLQNNNLLDEDRLSFLIDLDKKNPEAIKKLVKDSGIDPMEIDTTSEPAYSGGHHRVTDQEVNFKSALEDLGSAPGGNETLKLIQTWDQASKDVLWENPEAMATIHAQREVGIFDRIAAEVDRRKTIGTISQGTPFLEAYHQVGEEMTKADAFADLREKHSGNAPTETAPPAGQQDKETAPTPVATRAAAPKPDVDNDAAARAASPTRTAPKPVKEFINPLSMADDEFLKQFDGRL